jgi:hypothetical protein
MSLFSCNGAGAWLVKSSTESSLYASLGKLPKMDSTTTLRNLRVCVTFHSIASHELRIFRSDFLGGLA